jgi:hypothetical protein
MARIPKITTKAPKMKPAKTPTPALHHQLANHEKRIAKLERHVGLPSAPKLTRSHIASHSTRSRPRV